MVSTRDRISAMGYNTVGLAEASVAAGPDPVGAQPAVAIQVERLRKTYGDLEALAGATFEARPGEIFGILGPNGAGKTTLIEILEGLRRPESGTATVLGVHVPKHLDLIRDRIGIAMQKMALPPLLTVQEVLRLYAAVYPRSEHPDPLIACVGLEEKRQTRIHRLSGGQLQRLTVALALVGNPQVLFLDEPTSELDPQGRRALWNILLDPQKRNHRTVVLTTHQMEEAQQLCDRVAILDRGHILAMGSPSELIHHYCPGQVIRFTTQAHADLQECVQFASVERHALSRTRDAVTARTDALEPAMEVLMAARLQGRYSVEDLRVERMTLEDVFLHVTGRRMRD